MRVAEGVCIHIQKVARKHNLYLRIQEPRSRGVDQIIHPTC